MIIDFNEYPVVEVKNFKGGLGSMLSQGINDDKNRIMKGILKKGSSIGYHIHDTSSEIVYVLQGEAHFVIEGKDEYVKAGQVHYCKQGLSHSCTNDKDEDLVILAIVPQHK